MIMCEHGKTKMVRLNRPRPSGRIEIPVDFCISDTIQDLNDKGVITYGCCCGHGKRKPECLVDIRSKELLEKMGYTLHTFSERHTELGIYEIYL